MGSVNGGPGPGWSQYYGGHGLNRAADHEPASDSWSYAGNERVHRSPRRTTSVRQRRRSSSRTIDQRDHLASTMAPPPGAPPARAATVAYRRPVNCLAPDVRPEASERRHSTRDASPAYGRTTVGHYSRQPSEERGLGYDGVSRADDDDDGYDDDDHIEVVEVIEVVGKEPARHSERRRRSSRHDHVGSSSGRRHDRRGRRAYADEDMESRRHYAASDGGSAAYAPSRTLDQTWSVDSPQGRRGHGADVIEDSRPPVSSKRLLVHRRHTSVEANHAGESRPRRSSTVRPSRTRAVSVTGGPSAIIGAMFGAPVGRQERPKERSGHKKRAQCSTCLEDTNPTKMSKLKCGHTMCRACLRRIFNMSVSDPQHMPPRCCRDYIPLRHVDRLFDNAFKRTWNRKFAEYSTKNRIYCPSRRCGEWIKPANIRRGDGRKVARCGRCSTKVCCSCGGRWHGTKECPTDAATANLLAQANEEGWKRCYKCRALIELKEGCNHMTCRCGAEFCMICGAKWKSCDCPWFNSEERGGEYLDDMNVPAADARGDLGDIFDGDGPPAPPELRGYTGPGAGYPMVLPIHRRPRNYQEEVQLRMEQEEGDAELARQLQYNDDYYDRAYMMGDVGDIKVSGHHMKENYRRGGRGGHGMSPSPAQHDSRDGRAEGMSDSRSGTSPPRTSGSRYPVGVMPAAPAPPPPHMDVYDGLPYRPRSERGGGGRMSRDYDDEAELHSPPRSSRRHGREGEDGATGSDLAGLSRSRGCMNRVSQWRTYVEPGVPDGESTVGHA